MQLQLGTDQPRTRERRMKDTLPDPPRDDPGPISAIQAAGIIVVVALLVIGGWLSYQIVFGSLAGATLY
jgi:hypothetical protein